ncbi:GSCFA domain-containing protein [Draconibacterium sp. IB214405]|uniref:GSCFA domain-containing protein n=1 Tax=Draconibacterium sp. IB214405 TaxID=3097352 RepID=UPI002A13DA70|nr:GSCFA domain-containing protein [Draconibacterium sp. IB214405]MDX8337596.1 GSCFA domain-containing protein [Draconibacterium sp. IB214405]
MAETKFQTIVDVPQFLWQTGYKKKNLFMGSCFTENVGAKMEALKYPVDINPFGILYNPLSVANGLQILLDEKQFGSSDLVEHNGLWHSFSHHGRFSNIEKDVALDEINSRIVNSATFLKEADFLYITFGTAWIYRYKKDGELVSNCHKIPAREFVRERLSVQQILDVYRQLLTKLWEFNPKLKVVFTVSPIRHWKDGAVENQRSKATLILAVDQLVQEFGSEKCAYFPSYEIVMDELRDYRFYAEDMLHISEVAIKHIWERFAEALIDAESLALSKEVVKITNAVKHRPINKNSIEFSKFLLSFLKKTGDLEKRFPYLNLKLEKEYFNTQIEDLGSGDETIVS